MFKKFTCPVCGKELIRLEPFESDEAYEYHDFWCDTCDVDIRIGVSKNTLNFVKKEIGKNE